MNLVVVDSNFICYKSMVAMKGLSWQEHATGVIFGFLREIQQLSEMFPSAKFAFTWDSRKSFRRDVYPEYKRRPKTDDPEMQDLIRSGIPQFAEIRLKVLHRLGFRNNFIEVGLEADDIIAWLVNDYAWEMESIHIISADEDLYQLLVHKNVTMYNPRTKRYFNKEIFENEYGISPGYWTWVKAIAGCTSDNVKGVKGVGEKTVIKYIRSELKTDSKKFIDTQSFVESPDYHFNMSLVRLPHERSYPVALVSDELNFDEWEPMCLDYGFNSFLKKDMYNKWRQILRGANNGVTQA